MTRIDRDRRPHTGTPFSFSAVRRLAAGRLPGQVVIQYTDRCNAACAQCGMRRGNEFARSTMDKDQARRLIDAMAERGVTAISFTGGEPLLYLDDVVELAAHARSVGIPYVRTGTNGFLFQGADRPGFEDKIHKLARTIAESPLNTFWISLDSASAEVHEVNRGLHGVVRGVEQALPILHDYGVYPAANLGINRLTGGLGPQTIPALDNHAPGGEEAEGFLNKARVAFRRFYGFAAGLGFTTVNACYPMSHEADEDAGGNVYAASSSDDFIHFTAEEKRLLFQALYEVIPEYRAMLRIFTPRSSLLALIRQYDGAPEAAAPCRGGRDFFFVDAANMDTFPCGYRGEENLGKFWDLDMDSVGKGEACRLCDWECFRDPSELAGPLLGMLRRPVETALGMLRDGEMRRTWREDVRYLKACDYCNARVAPKWERLDRFGPPHARTAHAPWRDDVAATQSVPSASPSGVGSAPDTAERPTA